MQIKELLKSIYEFYKRTRNISTAKVRAKKIALMDNASYFPEKETKSKEIKVKENIEWAKKFGEPNEFYYLYGLDVVGSSSDEFIDYLSFMNSRNEANHILKWGGSQTLLLRDKFLFYKYMKSNGMPVPEVFCFMKNGYLYDSDFNEIKWSELEDEEDYFVKDIDGECASFVKHIENYKELMDVKEHIKTGGYIFQRKVVQCSEMDRLNKGAINTLRIITINRNGEPYVLSSLLRVGTSKTGNVDNWAAGGLAIGIDGDGYLKEYGFYKPCHGLKACTHPDSGIKFAEYKVPSLDDAFAIACKAHKTFYDVRAIGWDIAITEDGPIFIEGNDNFEISLQQACDRPLKKEWIEAMR